MTEAVILALLESALRSALLGLLVSGGIALFRLRDVRTETALWTLVLTAAIAMPALASVLPHLFPQEREELQRMLRMLPGEWQRRYHLAKVG